MLNGTNDPYAGGVSTIGTRPLTAGLNHPALKFSSDSTSTSSATRSGTEWVAEPAGAREVTNDKRIELKMEAFRLGRHLEDAWRSGLFAQLDDLLDPDEWEMSDKMPSVESFRTFLRMIVFLGDVRRPSLGTTAAGNVLAGWFVGRDRLTIECLPADEVRWVLSWTPDEERESAAGLTTVKRLPEVVAPYGDLARWFAVADNIHS